MLYLIFFNFNLSSAPFVLHSYPTGSKFYLSCLFSLLSCSFSSNVTVYEMGGRGSSPMMNTYFSLRHLTRWLRDSTNLSTWPLSCRQNARSVKLITNFSVQFAFMGRCIETFKFYIHYHCYCSFYHCDILRACIYI